MSSNSSIRLLSLELICLSKKTISLPSNNEYDLLLKYLKNAVKYSEECDMYFFILLEILFQNYLKYY